MMNGKLEGERGGPGTSCQHLPAVVPGEPAEQGAHCWCWQRAAGVWTPEAGDKSPQGLLGP